jgi:predicted DNA-binding ArsR family transcriptional regulator
MGGPNTPFRCDDNGYWTSFTWPRLEAIYGGFGNYAGKFMESVDRLVDGRWVTPEDGQKIRDEFHARHGVR